MRTADGRTPISPAIRSTRGGSFAAARSRYHASKADRTAALRSSPSSARGTSASNCQWWNRTTTRSASPRRTVSGTDRPRYGSDSPLTKRRGGGAEAAAPSWRMIQPARRRTVASICAAGVSAGAATRTRPGWSTVTSIVLRRLRLRTT